MSKAAKAVLPTSVAGAIVPGIDLHEKVKALKGGGGGKGAVVEPGIDEAADKEAKRKAEEDRIKSLEGKAHILRDQARSAGAVRGDNEADTLQYQAPTARRKNVSRTLLG